MLNNPAKEYDITNAMFMATFLRGIALYPSIALIMHQSVTFSTADPIKKQFVLKLRHVLQTNT